MLFENFQRKYHHAIFLALLGGVLFVAAFFPPLKRGDKAVQHIIATATETPPAARPHTEPRASVFTAPGARSNPFARSAAARFNISIPASPAPFWERPLPTTPEPDYTFSAHIAPFTAP